MLMQNLGIAMILKEYLVQRKVTITMFVARATLLLLDLVEERLDLVMQERLPKRGMRCGDLRWVLAVLEAGWCRWRGGRPPRNR